MDRRDVPEPRCDADAGVCNIEEDGGSAAGGQHGDSAMGAQSDGAAGGHAIAGVLREVDQDLLKLLSVAGKFEEFGGVDIDVDFAGLEFRCEQALDGLEEFGRIDARGLRFGWAGELEEAFGEAFKAIDLGADGLEVVVLGERGADGFLQAEQAKFDGGEWIADFVGDAGGEDAERGKFLVTEIGGGGGIQPGLEWKEKSAMQQKRKGG